MKKFIPIILAITLISVLTLSLSGCLMVTLRENSILERFAENEFTVLHSHSLIPFSDERMSGLSISKCFTGYKDDPSTYDEFGGVGAERWEVSVYFMEDSASAAALVKFLEDEVDKLNKHYDDTMSKLEGGNAEDGTLVPKRYLVYRYNDIVVFGDWQSVSLVRGY